MREGNPNLGQDANIMVGLAAAGVPVCHSLPDPAAIDVMIDFSLPAAAVERGRVLSTAEDPPGRWHDRLQPRPEARAGGGVGDHSALDRSQYEPRRQSAHETGRDRCALAGRVGRYRHYRTAPSNQERRTERDGPAPGRNGWSGASVGSARPCDSGAGNASTVGRDHHPRAPDSRILPASTSLFLA